ncbi:hypothetical protein PVL29_005021 [Vitis rotundifolia]|uniref:Sterol methyltransferase C-terminal domain-containing protein n=1 Tax=Vitis rotundifolia TaxID=103349 RepID=A0AA39E178_VITRO|nr:hypothetical protein PVL29_005021 [Vitis rotundifolia]
MAPLNAVFAIEATCHAPDVFDCYKEIYRVLKPSQCFAVYEWCITDCFDPMNREHQRINGEVELGNGLPDIRLKNVVADSPFPWYLLLDTTQNMVKALEFARLAPKGSQRVQAFLEKAAEALVEGDKGGATEGVFLHKAPRRKCTMHGYLLGHVSLSHFFIFYF